MSIETVKMSSKGQVVIPMDIREEIGADEGTLFAVMGTDDSIVLKKIETPSREKLIKELEQIAKEGRRRLQQKGIKEADIPGIIEKSRKR